MQTTPAAAGGAQPQVRPVGLPQIAPSAIGTARVIEVAAGSVEIQGKLVALAAFAIDRMEVTTGEYAQCVAKKNCSATATDDIACNWPKRKIKADHPINCVTLDQAKKYCAQNGQRLPTAAEWQLAAGGSEKRYYPWGAAHPSNIAVTESTGDTLPGPARHHLCWIGDGTDREEYPWRTCPVGSFPAGNTPSGIADLAGNVAEWTSTMENLPHGGVRYHIKGGGYNFDRLGRLEVGVADVTLHDDQHYAPDVGFRCVTETPAPAP